MKRLFLVRHAKSSWKDLSLSDFERPLNKRGKHDAPMMAKIFKNEGFVIDTILSSPAKRAATTARFFMDQIGEESCSLSYKESIYEASAYELSQLLNAIDNNYQSAMLFGHNPGFTILAEKLSSIHFGNIPTCGIVGLEFEVNDWAHIFYDSGTLIYHDYPKKHY